jgi:hypothetical protein
VIGGTLESDKGTLETKSSFSLGSVLAKGGSIACAAPTPNKPLRKATVT